MSHWKNIKIVNSDESNIANVADNKGQDVNLLDRLTAPVDASFAQSVSNFTISVATTASTDIVLQYDFTATAGHGLAVGNEIILLDTAANRVLQAVVLNVATNVITIDRPIDFAFAVATTLGRIVITNMAVDGSVTSQLFSVRAGSVPFNMTRFILSMTATGTAMDDSMFGNLTALTRGLVFRVVNSYQKTIFNFKTNQDIKLMCFDADYSDKAPTGSYGFSARLSFAGAEKHGVPLQITTDDVIQWVVQDDLRGLDTLMASDQGHEVPTS